MFGQTSNNPTPFVGEVISATIYYADNVIPSVSTTVTVTMPDFINLTMELANITGTSTGSSLRPGSVSATTGAKRPPSQYELNGWYTK